jgi:hypothetical protein
VTVTGQSKHANGTTDRPRLYLPTDRPVGIDQRRLQRGRYWFRRSMAISPAQVDGTAVGTIGRTRKNKTLTRQLDRGLLMVPRQLSTLPRPSGGNWNQGAIDACLRSSSVMMQRPCKFLLFLPLGKVFYSCAVSVSPRGKDVGQHCPWPSPSVVHLRYVFQAMVMAKVPPGIL